MRVAAQVSEDLFWSTKGRLGVDPLFARLQAGAQSVEGERLG